LEPRRRTLTLASQRSDPSVAVADAGVEHDLTESSEVGVGLLGGAHVRLGNNFGERSAATIVVHIRLSGGLRETFVKVFCGVVFEMETGDADALPSSSEFDFEPASGSERQFILRDLVALREVWIEIILAGESRMIVHSAI
jgi:hypothetical protein